MWLHSPTPESTHQAGCLLGRAIGAGGGVIGLCGALGAGKTLFVKGLAQGLGLDPQQVSSPTFVIANEYPLTGGRILAHVDLYRLASEEELAATGFLDWLTPVNVIAVEWSDRLPQALPADQLVIRLTSAGSGEPAGGTDGDSQRRLNAIASGPGAQALLARWRTEVADATPRAGLRVEPDAPAR